MPTIYGHRLLWVEAKVPCTECDAPYDGTWFMVAVTPGAKLLCRGCLRTWKEAQKPVRANLERVMALFSRRQ